MSVAQIIIETTMYELVTLAPAEMARWLRAKADLIDHPDDPACGTAVDRAIKHVIQEIELRLSEMRAAKKAAP